MKTFVIFYLCLFFGYFLVKDALFTESFLDMFCMFLANTSAQVVWIFDDTMFMEGPILRVVGGSGVWVTSECSALNFTWFLCAAAIAYPAPWKLRILIPFAAIAFVQSINIVRLVSLYFVQKWSPENFDFVHLDIWPIIFVISIVISFLSWVAYLQKNDHPEISANT